MANFKDPITSLSFGLHQGPGQFALLLGSGISRSAGIPTGWGITMDLVSKLPDAPRDADDGALLDWYRSKFECEPSYSSLIGGLASSEVERRNLLEPYFKPTQEEREDGMKVPSKAHRAIAKMVGVGLIRVIITTNFDRLMEQALLNEGITPDVVYHESGIAGAMPYAHSKCLVIKVHGDYVDSRLRNTEDELSAYTPELRAYLLHILDEHGLLVCGWSADYDDALIEAIKSSPNRRFGMYWMHTSALSEKAKDVVEARRGTLVAIDSADQAFEALLQKTETLQELNLPKPLDIATVVASAKRFIPRPEHRIQLSDLVADEISTALQGLESEDFLNQAPDNEYNQAFVDEYRSRVAKFEAASTRICALAATLSFYGEPEHIDHVIKIVDRLAHPERKEYQSFWTRLRYYPAFLALYVSGSAAIAAGRIGDAARILSTPTSRSFYDQEDKLFIENHVGYKILGDDPAQYLHLTVPKVDPRRFAPIDDHLVSILPSFFAWTPLTDPEILAAYSQFHYLLQLIYADSSWEGGDDQLWVPPGQYYKLRFMFEGWKAQPQAKLEKQLLESASNPLLELGFFNKDRQRLVSVNDKVKEFLAECARLVN